MRPGSVARRDHPRGAVRRMLLCAAALCAFALRLDAQPVGPLARQYRESPSPARREALLRLAAQSPGQTSGALALLAVGVRDVESGDYAAAVRHLEAAEPRLGQIADYLNYYLGLAYSGLAQQEAAARRLEAVAAEASITPLAGRAALALGKVHLDAGAPARALSALLARYSELPQPEGDLSLAYAHETAGALAAAASYGQRVYYGHPASKEAEAAAALLARLRDKLGAGFPPPLPADMLGRAGKWLETGNYQRARKEYDELSSELGGTDRELAQVRSGAARYLAGAAEAASRYLRALRLRSPEADAERLCWLVQCARRLEDAGGMRNYIEELGSRHPGSPWRLEALVWAGNYHLLRNEPGAYWPLFAACHEQFPSSPRAEYCYWKIAWNAYMERDGKAAGMLDGYLKRYPQGEKAPAALYFLGRLAEASGEEPRSYYRQIVAGFPGSYYYQLAEEKLGGRTLVQAASLSFEPGPAERERIRRARLLHDAGLSALGDGELRHAARKGGMPQVLAMELARQATERESPDQGVRHIKGAFPGYLSVPLEAAPPDFWRLAFPLPYRALLQRYAKAHALDLHLLAGLIRQESEFGARSVSRAGARGLMQVLPSTGRQLSTRLKIGGYSAASLFNPDINLRLGSYYLRSLLDAYDGRLEPALAAYNGGKVRVDQWLTWAAFREPAEFIETIPITETRGYVQAVIRNAWVYQRIYSGKPRITGAAESVRR